MLGAKNYIEAINVFESKLNTTTDIDLIYGYVYVLYRNKGTEKKGLKLAISYSKSNEKGKRLYEIIGDISDYFKKHNQAKDYYEKAKLNGFNVDEKLQKVKMLIAKREEEEKIRKEKEERIKKEELERKRIEKERKKEEELERIRNQEIKDQRDAAQHRKEERERQREEEVEIEERERQRKEEAKEEAKEEESVAIGSNYFTSDWKRGGDVLLREHIEINDDGVTWSKKKTLLFGSDKSTIPINEVTRIILDTGLIGTDITIKSKGFGSIKGTNFKKYDANQIKELIQKAQGNK